MIMIEKVSTPVSVGFTFDSKKKKTSLKWVVWAGRLHPVIKVGFHHTYKKGRTLFHVFSVESKTLFFRLELNTESLHWRVEEISDGLPD